jgi:hypothetical protein
MRQNTGAAKKNDAGAPKTVIESPQLEVAPCQFVGQYDIESMRGRWPNSDPIFSSRQNQA